MLESGSLNVEQVGDRAVVIALRGEWDGVRVEEFMATAIEAVTSGGRRHVVVDLCEVNFLDSRMLSALLQLQKASEDAHWSFALVRPFDDGVWRIFQRTNLDMRFASFEKRIEALLAAP